VRNHRRPSDFIDEVIDDLLALGIVRPGYEPPTALRRLKEFLSRNVYRVLVPIEDLSPEVQRGLRTGGTQRVHSNGSSRM